jgi:hypothetical protein
MYSLGSHELTIKHLDLEHKCRGRIDIHTGEHFDWFRNGIERADLHHGLELNSPYEYSSTVQPTTSADAQKALSTQHTNSINSAALGIQITRSSGVRTFEEVYSYDEDSDYDDCNDYEDACHYQNNQPSIVSLKDIIVDMA